MKNVCSSLHGRYTYTWRTYCFFLIQFFHQHLLLKAYSCDLNVGLKQLFAIRSGLDRKAVAPPLSASCHNTSLHLRTYWIAIYANFLIQIIKNIKAYRNTSFFYRLPSLLHFEFHLIIGQSLSNSIAKNSLPNENSLVCGYYITRFLIGFRARYITSDNIGHREVFWVG